MLRNKFTILGVVILFALVTLPVSADENKRSNKVKDNDIDKFQAHEEVKKLQKENIIKLNLIEIISKNFGYTTFYKLKKDYITAKLQVSKRQITEAKKILIKNKQELDDALRIISSDYHDSAQKIIDECIDKINELEAVSDDANFLKKKKITQLRDKIKIANEQFENANEAFLKKRYVSSISLYRSSKSYAIDILRNLADPEERNKIDDKFKIHIVDNRNEIYKKG